MFVDGGEEWRARFGIVTDRPGGFSSRGSVLIGEDEAPGPDK